jgi:ribonuclease-3
MSGVDLSAAAEALGHSFTNESLLEEALTHASIADHRLRSNERMEFLGDAVLGFVVSEYLFRTFPEDLEGEMTKVKSSVVSRRICAKVSERLQLVELMSLGKGMTSRPVMPASVAAAALEAVIAAIYLDGGIEPARQFILSHFRPFIHEAAASAHQHNFKSVLQQYAQRQLTSNPLYVLLDEKGPDHAKCFEVCVEIDGRRYGSAWAQSKKEAEQKAALIALEEIGVAERDEVGRVVVHDEFERLPDQDSVT